MTADQAVEHSRLIKDRLLRAHARGQRAHRRLQVNGWQDDEARAWTEAVLAARHARDHALLGLYLTLDAYYQFHRSEYLAAVEAAEEGLPLALEASDDYHYMSCQYFKALALLHLGEWGEGLRIARDGLELAEKNAHGLATRVFQYGLSWFHEQAFDFATARELCERAVQQTMENEFVLFFGLIRLGTVHLGLRQWEEAFRCFWEVTRKLERGAMMDWIWHMHLHSGLSEHWMAQRDFVRARQEANRACALAAQSGERTRLALGRRTLAEIALAERDWAAAEAEIRQAEVVLAGRDLPLAEWRVYATAADLHRRQRRKAAAQDCRARSRGVLRRLADSLGNEASLRHHMHSHMPV
jgi:hypothetical protein